VGKNKNVLEVEVDMEEGEVSEIGVGVLDAESAKQLADFLHEELESCETERAGRARKWKKWRRQREGIPEKETQDYPFANSANTSVPLASMLTQNMYAYIKATFQVRDPLLAITTYREEDSKEIERAKVLEKYLDLIAESPFDMNLREKLPEIVYEGSSMGTEFVKVPWTSDRWVFKTTDDDGNMTEVSSYLHDGPEWVPISLDDLFYRENVTDLQRAAWVSHRVTLSEPELHNRNIDGVYENVEEVMRNFRTEELESRSEGLERRGVALQPIKVYDLYETYVFFKLPDSDYMIDLLVTYHRESNKIMRAEYNELGIRPIGPARYIVRPHSLDGIGVGWLCEHMQDEVDTHHRMRINNAHFSGMRMFAIKRNAGIKGQEKVFPGKIWKVDDPTKDIVSVQAGEVYPSSLEAESMAMMYAERVVGFSDAQRGMSDQVAKSGTSASLQMFNAQQGGKLINSVIEGMVNSASMFALFTVFQLVKNRKRVIINETEAQRLNKEEIDALDQALDMPLETIPRRLKFSVRTTEMDQTFEVRKQNTLTLWQILGTFWEKTIPLLMQLENPQVPEMVKVAMTKAFTGGARLLEQTFKFFGEADTKKYVPDYKRLEILAEIRTAMQGDVGQLKQMLEVVQSGQGQRGINPGAAGTQLPAQGSGGNTGAPGAPGMETQVANIQRPAGGAGQIA